MQSHSGAMERMTMIAKAFTATAIEFECNAEDVRHLEVGDRVVVRLGLILFAGRVLDVGPASATPDVTWALRIRYHGMETMDDLEPKMASGFGLVSPLQEPNPVLRSLVFWHEHPAFDVDWHRPIGGRHWHDPEDPRFNPHTGDGSAARPDDQDRNSLYAG